MSEGARPVLFISDLHLDDARPDITRALRAFIEDEAPRARALYILGDFFNVWIGDDAASKLAAEVSGLLAQLTAGGTRVFLMHGNRDFLLGGDFTARCGATLINEPHLLDCFGRRYLLVHGDALCTRDEDYMSFRRMVRNRDWQQGFLARPVKERRAFAAEARARSKAMSSNKAEDIMDVTPEEVGRLMREHEVATLIHGHTHRPAVHEIYIGTLPARRIVLGDWDHSGWYLKISSTGEELRNFPL